MNVGHIGRRAFARCLLVVGLSASGLCVTGTAVAGCGLYGTPPASPSGWAEARAATGSIVPAVDRVGPERRHRRSTDRVAALCSPYCAPTAPAEYGVAFTPDGSCSA